MLTSIFPLFSKESECWETKFRTLVECIHHYTCDALGWLCNKLYKCKNTDWISIDHFRHSQTRSKTRFPKAFRAWRLLLSVKCNCSHTIVFINHQLLCYSLKFLVKIGRPEVSWIQPQLKAQKSKFAVNSFSNWTALNIRWAEISCLLSACALSPVSLVLKSWSLLYFSKRRISWFPTVYEVSKYCSGLVDERLPKPVGRTTRKTFLSYISDR